MQKVLLLAILFRIGHLFAIIEYDKIFTHLNGIRGTIKRTNPKLKEEWR